jgi:putative ABC transport system permease protein
MPPESTSSVKPSAGLLAAALRVFATLTVAIKRMLAQPGLMVATLVGLVMVAALVMSIPIYAEGVYYRVLSEGLFSDAPSSRGDRTRPPVALLFRYVGAFAGPLQWHDVTALDGFFQDAVYGYLRLSPSPEATSVRMFNTGLFGFYPEHAAANVSTQAPDLEIALLTLGASDVHLTLLDGALPSEVNLTGEREAPIDVLVPQAIANTHGVQVGDLYIAYDRRAMRRYEAAPARFTLRVAGVWEPAHQSAEFWDYVQIPLDNTLIVSESAFAGQISPALSDEIYQAMWYLPMDASQIFVSDVETLLTRMRTLERAVQTILPNTNLDVSPIRALERYRVAANLLEVLLLASSIPIIGLMLAFVVLMATLNTERQRNQIAALRSRGALSAQIAGITALESVVLGAIALLFALPLSLFLANMIGQTRTFLDFSLRTDFRVGITWPTVALGALAMGFTLVVQVAPTLDAARHTVVTYKREQARALRPPWWQRMGLDGLLLIPGVYGAYLLSQQGSLLGSGLGVGDNPFSNPLLFLVPALTLFALTLVLLRVLPLLLRLAAWIFKHTPSVSLLMAARQLARAPGLYVAPLGLLVLTLALSTYTASVAATLDTHLFDKQSYRIGSDISLVDTGEELIASDMVVTDGGRQSDSDGARWRFLPVSDYLKLPGVISAARVGRYAARVQTPSGYVPGSYIGIDRGDFAPVAFWRADFAPESLGGLMNSLAGAANSVLLPRSFMQEQVLNVGDPVLISVQVLGRSVTVGARIAGAFDYFPTWYPESGPLVVGNLDYFFQEAQASIPYRVWMRTLPDLDHDHLGEAVFQMNLGAQAMMIAQRSISNEQRQPEHQGLLGLLSIGFTAAAMLTALGFMLYGLFSFRRRSVELGVLRATGLSARHMMGIVAWELALILIVGAAAGTGLGIWASKTFVPYLQIGGDMTARVPPFIVEIAWPALFRLYGLFALLFVVALIILVRLLTRMKLFQAIKLGETL